MPGPPPKRSDQRRRTNKPAVPVDKAEGAGPFEPPAADEGWHPVAVQWFSSLAGSGQARFYEPSDWATAFVIAESMSREFKPQVVGVDLEGKPIFAKVPPKGASLAAWLKGMTALMVTEGDRRRLRLELERPKPAGEEANGDVAWIDDARDRIRGAG